MRLVAEALKVRVTHLPKVALLLLLGPAGARASADAGIQLPPKYTWDIPQPLESVDVPGVMESQGIPMKLHAIRSKLSRPALMDYVARSFVRGNLYVAPPEQQAKVSSDPQITGLDPFRMIAYTVIFQANPDGTTTAILAESHLGARKPQGGNYIAPLYPGANAPIQTDVEGLRTLTYTTVAPREELVRFYQQSLRSHGYVEEPGLKFRKGDRQLQLRYDKKPGEPARVTLLEGPYRDEGLQPVR